MSKVLVAGIGNVFFSDDGFGVEVVHRLDPATLDTTMPPGTVSVADYGIRGVHLAYDLLDCHYDTLILVDAVPLGQEPGTVAVLDATTASWAGQAATVDAHSMSPATVLQTLNGLGGTIDRVLVLGCQPDSVAEGMGLSAVVAAAVDDAIPRLINLAWAEFSHQAESPHQAGISREAEPGHQASGPIAAAAAVSSRITPQVSAQGRSL